MLGIAYMLAAAVQGTVYYLPQ